MTVLPPIASPGGKVRQAQMLLSHVPQHRTWVEVFCFSAAMTLQKDRAMTSETEVINDAHENLVNFWRVYQRLGPDWLAERMRYMLNSRAEFKRQQRLLGDANHPNRESSEEDRAFAYFYCNNNSVNKMGKVWSYCIKTRAQSMATRFDAERTRAELEASYKRIAGVQIECLDYADLLKRYAIDRKVFLYLDPPYFIATQNPSAYYGAWHSFGLDDHTKLARILKQTPALWLLSYDDHPDVRELYRDFTILSYEYQGTMGTGGSRNQRREVLILNYDPLTEGVQGRLL